MRYPVKERVICLMFKEQLPIESYASFVGKARNLLGVVPVFSLEAEKDITRPMLSSLSPPTFDGSLPDWTQLRLGIERCKRFRINRDYCVQLFRNMITFHLVEPSNGDAGSFDKLLDFYSRAVCALAGQDELDLLHMVDHLKVLYVNSIPNDDLVPYLGEGGSMLPLNLIIRLPNLGGYPDGVKPTPPTFRTTSYFYEGNPPINLCVELAIPNVAENGWIVNFNIIGEVRNIRIDSMNRWGAELILPSIHARIYEMFRSLLADDVLHRMECA